MPFHDQLQHINDRISSAAERCGRKRSDITLVSVTKTHPPSVIEEVFTCGLRDFGENRVQELIKKRDLLSTQIRWHLIGHLQSNKAKYIAPFVHLVHSIDSLDTAIELSRRAEHLGRTIDVLIEVNVAAEPQKHGVGFDDAEELFNAISSSASYLRVKGLMTVAPYEEYAENTRPYFRQLRRLRDRLSMNHPQVTELSMGMSNDFEVAIEEGATIVRIGSALFGDRM